MRKKLALSLLLALVVVTLFALPALAQDEEPGKLILGGTYILGAGEQLSGGIAIAGGDVVFERGSRVDGDVLLAGGRLQVAGRIDGDVAVFGGQLQLLKSAFVDGDVVNFGGSVQQEPGAVVTGQVNESTGLVLPGLPGLLPRVFQLPLTSEAPTALERTTTVGWLLDQFLRLLRALGLALAMGALALVVAVVWPKGVERIGRTIQEQPFLAFATGLLTWVVALGLAVVMLLSICLIPLAMVLGLVLVAAVILSWIAAGWVLGRLLLVGLKVHNATLVVETVLGTLVLILTYLLLSILPCVDFIFGVAVMVLGTGALVLTRFGTQPYIPTQQRSRPPSTAVAPVSPVQPAPPSSVRTGQELGLPADAADAIDRVIQ